MYLWRFVLDADRRLDLGDPARAKDWLSHNRLILHVIGRDEPAATENWDQGLYWQKKFGPWFVRRVLALRSVAARLKGFRASTPRLDPMDADRLFAGYLDYLRISPIQKRGR